MTFCVCIILRPVSTLSGEPKEETVPGTGHDERQVTDFSQRHKIVQRTNKVTVPFRSK